MVLVSSRMFTPLVSVDVTSAIVANIVDVAADHFPGTLAKIVGLKIHR